MKRGRDRVEGQVLFLYLCQWSLTDSSGCYREPDIRMIVEMVLRVKRTDLLRQLNTSSGSPVRSNGRAESQRTEKGFEARNSGLPRSESIL